MLGKRPRPLQRTSSRLLLMPNDPLVCPPSNNQLHEKPKPPSPAFGAPPRQVFGFNPVNKNPDAGGSSPRSVLDPKALSGIASVTCQEKQARSPRSPRSGLESLLSSPRCPWDKKGSGEGVGLGIVAAMHTAEDDAGKNRPIEVPKGCTGPVCQGVASKSLSARSPTLSQPIPIIQAPLQPSSHGSSRVSKENYQSRPVQNDEDQHEGVSWSSRGRKGRPNARGPLCVDVPDVEMDTRESIFSTSSPASSCNENLGNLPVIDFLNACFFCKRQLGPGKDIYMYRGDRAFCSVECRYQQIVIDERKERCSAAAYKGGATVQPGAPNHRGRVLAATTAAAA